jgi:hypothetical protein
VVSLEAELSRVQGEAERYRQMNAASTSRYNPTQSHQQPRSTSRTSTIYPGDSESRSGTPVGTVNGTGRRPSSRTSSVDSLVPQRSKTSIQDSIHAPKNQSSARDTIHAPQKRYPNYGYANPAESRNQSHYQRPSAPSPTPSTVSAAPTEGPDGWWS